MRQLWSIAAVTIATCVATLSAAAEAPPEATRIPFQIATGPISGSYFPIGEAVARIISNPPGFGRCEDTDVCGPEGLLASSRASGGSIANAIAVHDGRVTSALIQGDIAALAFEGQGPFKKTDAFKDLRVLARMQSETLHIVAGARSRIKRLSDLKGKRVAIDAPLSATNVTARAVFTAAGLKTSAMKLSFQTPEQAADDLKSGKIDAFFAIGSAPVKVVDGLMRRGSAKLVPLDAPTLARLTQSQKMFSAKELPEDTYRGSKAVKALSITALWVASTRLPDDVAYSITRALWSESNRGQIDQLGVAGATMRADVGLDALPLPIHPGAAKFYSEMKRLEN